MAEELLYRNDSTQVLRQTATDDAGSLICKRAFGPGAVRRIDRERAVLRHLAGVPGVPRLADRQARQSLFSIDDGGAPIAVSRLSASRLLDVARELTGTVAAMHRAGVLHHDITPANVVLTGSGTPVLIDYDMAEILPPGSPAIAPPDQPLGTLGYQAPEQTGRLRLPVDQRADLYGLGATLYALATGESPFPGDDPLDVIRDTLVRCPVSPAGRHGLPPAFADIILRLLEKDPDRRYQSAEALAHDLDCFGTGHWRLGEHDFPAVLTGPADLVGRDDEIRMLVAALDRAQTGGPALLIGGPAGVGKSSLVTALRRVVTARGGWFINGKYDQFRTGTGSGGIRRAMAKLAGLLLAEPEPDITADRRRIVAALGANLPVILTAVPELTPLLGARAEPADDPGTAPARVTTAIIALLKAVAGQRPVVLAVDDLQWASHSSLQIFETIVAAGPIPGLLIVGTYRDHDAGHPLAALAARGERNGRIDPPIRITGLDPGGLTALVGAVLRLPVDAAAGLAELLHEPSGGNPYTAVELLNALRGDGLLTLGRDGWRWDPEAARAFLARKLVPDVMTDRLARLPGPTRRVLTALACLGGDTPPAVLAAALRMPAAALIQHLAPAAAARLIGADRPGTTSGTVRFRHDLIHRAAYDALDEPERARMQLAMARNLADRDDARQEAAEQYLAAADLLDDPRERRAAAQLLHAAGCRAAQLTNYVVAEELYRCADRLAPADVILADRHAALYCLGRLADADEVYRSLVDRSPGLPALAAATPTQINSLTQRGASVAAIDLGVRVLARFGIALPTDLAAAVDAGVDWLYRWAERIEAGQENTAETTDPRIIAAGRVINRLLAPAFYLDPLMHAWLVLQAQQLWERHGVCAPFVGTLGAVVAVTIDLRDDYRTGYRLTAYTAAVGRRHGYQAETAVARYMHLCLAAHWCEPAEGILEVAQQTRDDLIAVGDVQVASMLSNRLSAVLVDCGETLDAAADEITSSLAFAERTGARFSVLSLTGYRQLIRALQGRTDGPGSLVSADFDEAEYLAGIAAAQAGLATYHTNRALAAMIFDDEERLEEASAAAMTGVRAIRGFYNSMLARVTRAVSLARRIRAGADTAAVRDLDEARSWLARRAADCPHNFRPLLHLVEAERAWALGDPVTATREYDAGLTEVSGRPWHRALLAERAGLFHLSQGLEYGGRRLLADALDAYCRWGAQGKADAMTAAHPFLRAAASPATGSHGPGGETLPIDLMAVLRASQALSSQTTVAGLQAQVGDLLAGMTGATVAHLVLQHQETSDWYASAIAGPDREQPAAVVADPANPGESRLPLAAIRYALRTREPLLVDDATGDDRFSHDPYLSGLDLCALLVVPVPSHNVAHAVLVLENHRQRGIFSTDRLETVRLIAGQLAVSLDNAILYDSLDSAVRARTADLAAATRRLADSERRVRSHFEHAAVGQVIHGIDDRIEEANPAFLDMVGTTARKLTGSKLTELFAVPDRDAHRRDLDEVIADRRPRISRELTLMRADGRHLDAQVTVSAVRDADGRPAQLVSILQDISARRAAEAARDAAHLELADRNRELEAANQLKSDLMGMLGHEIGNPLAMILGHLELARTDDDLPEPFAGLLERIHRNARRLDTIVNEVLALVRIDAGQLTALPSPTVVADHIDAALAAGAATGVPVDCPRGLVALMQPSHLDHVLINLISNAAKYGGGVTAIVAFARRASGTAVLEVHDEGPGVPPDFRDRLFGRLTRADSTASTAPGTGLGLYIVRELARANGGDVTYRPAAGHGSVFVLTMPLALHTPDHPAGVLSVPVAAR
ncbi:putative multi-sensor signal transduction histidine kinase [Actinoplanes missouriensis 431]|uniref:histidine kinase n=1 Tax=Actinoplanes missouriensis (strain ATCC 14538 / DSM 43046 / CBS 188.64 / JCM 3121 / NBRC 102363 / NCIMB 12654 / NRRL B-3342 / UNCC 431) TaxID=512565 RepID=I0H5M2_ACTM4|nr:AAA family ATPase [Actinoplanes missouriensis]BAL88309.1 putative multi-sensor signal transduction histidine kinase [Actinoplanes missouriensis 431]